MSANTAHFGPFVADLAEAARLGIRVTPGRFAREVRAAGLARTLADGYGRPYVVLLIDVSCGATVASGTVADQEQIAAVCEWIAERGRIGVGLSESSIPAVDRFGTIVLPPSEASEPVGSPTVTTVEGTYLRYPAVAGRPHPGSDAEKQLAAALSTCDWARGGVWNMRYQPHPLRAPIVVDLMWEDARCVVELDGDDHRLRDKYAADRQRDVQLQLQGFGVLRFTNDQVLDDLSSVVSAIEQYVCARRLDTATTAGTTMKGRT